MDSEKIEKLTKRELEVLKLLAVGMYNKEWLMNCTSANVL